MLPLKASVALLIGVVGVGVDQSACRICPGVLAGEGNAAEAAVAATDPMSRADSTVGQRAPRLVRMSVRAACNSTEGIYVSRSYDSL
jgi:hypothetical protein